MMPLDLLVANAMNAPKNTKAAPNVDAAFKTSF
jgi:hypothetical protein